MEYDATGVSLDRPQRKLLEEGWYTFRIRDVKESKSKRGDFMAKVTCEVVENLLYTGTWVFHNVTFVPPTEKGAGMAVHFLKTIGEPWEGKIDIQIQHWLGAKFQGKVTITEYEGKKRNEITEVKVVGEKSEEDIPF